MIQGLLYAGLSALLSGSFAIFPKWASQRANHRRAPVPRPVTAWWLALGFVCASIIWSAFVYQVLSWWGLLSGLLWALTVVGRFACIESCGMCTGNATPDVTAAMTAWAYDRLYTQVSFTCPALGVLGYFLLTLCLISIYVLEQQGHVKRSLLAKLKAALQAGSASDPAAGQLSETAEDQSDANSTHLACPLIPHHHSVQHGGTEAHWVSVMWGLLLGCMSGVCSGLSQLPFTKASPGGGGVHFILSSSLGMLVCATLNVLLHRMIRSRAGLLESLKGISMHAEAMAPYGILGGMVLLASMVCGILAAGDEAVAYSGAKVVAEASILVSGAWGVLLFHELRSLLQVLFWLLSLQMLCSYAVITAGRVVTC